MNELRVTLVQTELIWEDAPANRSRLEQRLRSLRGQTDLVILPEMFTTGFSMDAAAVAEPMEGPTVKWMQQQARELEAVLAGSLVIKEKGHYFNRLIWMEPGGPHKYYDKRHLFGLAGEHAVYEPGRERLLVTWRGWTIMPLICYDLRFPVWSRNTRHYDLLFYIASWPDKRIAAWRTLLQARAIENQAFVAGVNRVGTDGNDYTFNGYSSLVDYQGQTLYSCAEQEDIFTATLHRDRMIAFRSRLPFLEDRDHFQLET